LHHQENGTVDLKFIPNMKGLYRFQLVQNEGLLDLLCVAIVNRNCAAILNSFERIAKDPIITAQISGDRSIERIIGVKSDVNFSVRSLGGQIQQAEIKAFIKDSAGNIISEVFPSFSDDCCFSLKLFSISRSVRQPSNFVQIKKSRIISR
jgi:hypothetical protein